MEGAKRTAQTQRNAGLVQRSVGVKAALNLNQDLLSAGTELRMRKVQLDGRTGTGKENDRWPHLRLSL